MDAWPVVEFGRGGPPRPSGGWVDEDLIRTREPRVVAWGRVHGIPWQLEVWTTAPGPDAKWWEHGPVGPEMAFWLGEDARHGGGGIQTRLNDGTHLAATGHFFGSVPDIAVWAGVVSDRVDRIDVRVRNGETRSVEVRRAPPWLPRFFCFFAPRGVAATAVALGADGEELQAEALPDVEIHTSANAATSVNDFGYPADLPPPGWPDDPTRYTPGEGPGTPRTSISTRSRSPCTSSLPSGGTATRGSPAAVVPGGRSITSSSAISTSPAGATMGSRS